MKGFAGLSIHIDKSELAIGLAIVSTLGILALWKKRFATKAEAWPTIAAKIENVFLDVSRGGPNRSDVTHTVLAYSYSLNDTYYSGQIRLSAGEVSLESVEKEMIGEQVLVHYNPQEPEISILLKHEIRGWLVVADRRISIWSWLG
jgi:hypothetical protein